jgi:hypothetical protein
MSDLDKRKIKLPLDDAVEAVTARKQKEYKEKHGESVTREDYNSYKNSFSDDSMSKPLTFTDYKDIASFYGKAMADDADLSLISKAGLDPEKYRPKEKKNKGGMVKSRTGPQDFRKGGMVLSTVDNRRNK